MTDKPKLTIDQLPTDPRTGEPLSPVRKRKVSPKVKKVVRTRIVNGTSWEDSCAAAGLSTSALYKAMNQPHVKAFYEMELGKYISDLEGTHKMHKAHSLKVARELVDNADSEQVKARMVEFFRGEGKKTGVQVNIQNNNSSHSGASGDYAFVRPGQRVVEITNKGATDVPSEGHTIEGTVNKD